MNSRFIRREALSNDAEDHGIRADAERQRVHGDQTAKFLNDVI